MALSFRICLIRTVTVPEILRNLLFGLACIRRLLKLIVTCLMKTSYQCSFMAFVTAVWLHSLPVYKSRKMIIFFHLICSWYLPAFVGLSGESAPSCSSTSCCSRVLVACCLFFFWQPVLWRFNFASASLGHGWASSRACSGTWAKARWGGERRSAMQSFESQQTDLELSCVLVKSSVLHCWAGRLLNWEWARASSGSGSQW